MLMAKQTLYFPALLGTLVAAVLMACAVALLTVSGKAEATFPGKNGRIAYSGYDGNDYEIYTINVNGGDKLQLTNNNRDDYSPSYSPDAKRIAYVGYDRNDAEIYSIKAGGRGKIKLTHNNAEEAAPSYSPDGMKIVYMVSKGNATGHTEIYTINAFGGGGKTKVTPGGQPSYSPEAKRSSFGTTIRQQQTPTQIRRSIRSTPSEGVRPNSPTTTTTSSLLTIRPTAKRSSTQAWRAWSVIMPRATSARSTPVGVVRENSPTTTSTTRILPTRPTAERSSTRCPKATPSSATSTRSTLSEGVRPNSPTTTSTTRILPGGVVRSGFSSVRGARGLEV
jgi:dipeptidyl aminopeptidase/acylaminoacyl peptidase